MGANAQTSVPTFTAGDVLTAANMNISARTGVPVFADTTARDAGFGGTGEKVLAEGQLCYVENLTGVAQIQYYDGASWVSLSGSGLVYVTGTSVSAVTSFSLPNSTFTSTYRNYRVIIEGVANNSGQAVTMRLRAGGTDDSAANYYGTVLAADFGGTTRTVVNNGNSSMTLLNTYSLGMSFNFDVMAPQASVATKWGGTTLGQNATYGGGLNGTFGGLFNVTTSFDSLSIILAGGHTFTGTYRVYGYADS